MTKNTLNKDVWTSKLFQQQKSKLDRSQKTKLNSIIDIIKNNPDIGYFGHGQYFDYLHFNYSDPYGQTMIVYKVISNTLHIYVMGRISARI